MQVRGAIEPKQQRSSETLTRILDTVERMLPLAGSLDALSLNDLCAEADVSRSSFYARFKSKDDMVPALCQRYEDRATELGAEVVEALIERGLTEPLTCGEATRYAMRSYLRFQQSLEIIDATGSDPRVLGVRLAATRRVAGHLRVLLEASAGEPMDYRQEEQILFLLSVIGTSVHPKGALPLVTRLIQWDEDKIVDSFSHLFCSYLTLDEDAPVFLA